LDYQLFCEEAWDKILSWYNFLEGQVGIHVEGNNPVTVKAISYCSEIRRINGSIGISTWIPTCPSSKLYHDKILSHASSQNSWQSNSSIRCSICIITGNVYTYEPCIISWRWNPKKRWPLWSWLYGSWIYNYLCNQCLSPLKLWVRTPFMARYTWYNIMW
jgi:hypothetical protein